MKVNVNFYFVSPDSSSSAENSKKKEFFVNF